MSEGGSRVAGSKTLEGEWAKNSEKPGGEKFRKIRDFWKAAKDANRVPMEQKEV